MFGRVRVVWVVVEVVYYDSTLTGLGRIRAATGVEWVGSPYAWAPSRLHRVTCNSTTAKYELMRETTF